MKLNSMRSAVVLGVVVAGCSNNLSEDEARRLVEAQPDFVNGVMCPVPVFVHFEEDGLWLVSSEACARALEQAHMVAGVGPCNIAGQCEITLLGAPTPQGNNMLLPCASPRLTGVSGIATTGNTAEFRYERDMVVSPAAAEAAELCDFELPEAGSGTRDRTARRDDAGNWSLVVATH